MRAQARGPTVSNSELELAGRPRERAWRTDRRETDVAEARGRRVAPPAPAPRWARQASNLGPTGYEPAALTN